MKHNIYDQSKFYETDYIEPQEELLNQSPADPVSPPTTISFSCKNQDDYDLFDSSDKSIFCDVSCVGANPACGTKKSRKGWYEIIKKDTGGVLFYCKSPRKLSLSTHYDKVKKKYYAYDHENNRSYWL